MLALASGLVVAGCATTAQEVSTLKGQLQQEQARCAKDSSTIEDLTGTNAKLSAGLQEEIKKGQVSINQLNDHLRLSVVQELLFDSGKAELRESGDALLGKVVVALKGTPTRMVTIEGHTDNIPIGAAIAERYPTNWELSTARATTVVRSLQEKGLDPRELGASGFGEFRPVSGNETAEGRQQNRRIDVILSPAFQHPDRRASAAEPR
jgi:chemotaxis protein MotB